MIIIHNPTAKDVERSYVFLQSGFSVLPPLVKSPYKTYYLNIPYFMRVRKRLNAEKIRKTG